MEATVLSDRVLENDGVYNMVLQRVISNMIVTDYYYDCFLETEIISLVDLNLSCWGPNCFSGKFFGAQSKPQGFTKLEAHIM